MTCKYNYMYISYVTITLYISPKDSGVVSRAKRKLKSKDTSLSQIFIEAVKVYVQPATSVRKLGMPSAERP